MVELSRTAVWILSWPAVGNIGLRKRCSCEWAPRINPSRRARILRFLSRWRDSLEEKFFDDVFDSKTGILNKVINLAWKRDADCASQQGSFVVQDRSNFFEMAYLYR